MFLTLLQSRNNDGSMRNAGFVMGGAKEVYRKPLRQKILEAWQEADKLAQPPKTKNAKRKARIIEVEAAELVLHDGSEDRFQELKRKWQAQRPVMPDNAEPDLLFMAQVAFRLRELEALQDDEDAILAILLS